MLHEIFRCGHQKGSWVDKNHKKKSKFRDIRYFFWHFSPFFLTRIITPWNWKKCSKGYTATIFITGYYYWRINFFFQNRLTSGWDTAKFFLKKKAPTKWQKPNLKEIFKKVRMCFWFWKIVTSKNQKLRFSNTANITLFHHFYQYLESDLLVYWWRQWTSKPRVVGSNPPRGKMWFWKSFFALFLDKKWYILYCNTLKKTEWKSLLLFKSI